MDVAHHSIFHIHQCIVDQYQNSIYQFYFDLDSFRYITLLYILITIHTFLSYKKIIKNTDSGIFNKFCVIYLKFSPLLAGTVFGYFYINIMIKLYHTTSYFIDDINIFHEDFTLNLYMLYLFCSNLSSCYIV